MGEDGRTTVAKITKEVAELAARREARFSLDAFSTVFRWTSQESPKVMVFAQLAAPRGTRSSLDALSTSLR